MDGAGNMAGKNAGCAARFTRHSPRALYHYCSSHDLNLVLCKSCQVKEVHIMLDTLKQLGIFYKYSPKRCRRLEEAIEEITNNSSAEKSQKKKKFKLFCETRWVEKHTCLDDFDELYEALLVCLGAISTLERNWDSKTVVEANGLLKRITDPGFIVCFATVHQYFGYFSGLSKKLQGSSLDVMQAYEMVESVKQLVTQARNDESIYDKVYDKASEMANVANLPSLEQPRVCSRQTNRSNVPASSPKEYFKRALYLPFVDAIVSQVSLRFSSLSKQVVKAACILPKNLHTLTDESVNTILSYYRPDLPSPSTFHQEVALWQQLWAGQDKPEGIQETMSDPKFCRIMFPNIHMILSLLLLVSATSSSVERANSSLRYIKNKQRSTMGQDRFNALMLMYVHRDICIDIHAVVDMYATKHPRKMLLINPLS